MSNDPNADPFLHMKATLYGFDVYFAQGAETWSSSADLLTSYKSFAKLAEALLLEHRRISAGAMIGRKVLIIPDGFSDKAYTQGVIVGSRKAKTYFVESGEGAHSFWTEGLLDDTAKNRDLLDKLHAAELDCHEAEDALEVARNAANKIVSKVNRLTLGALMETEQ